MFLRDLVAHTAYSRSPQALSSTSTIQVQFEADESFLDALYTDYPLEEVAPIEVQRKFAPPKTTKQLEHARMEAVPKKTLQDIKYCFKIWNEWKSYRLSQHNVSIPEIEELSLPDLAEHLSHFVIEVRKKNGDEFPPNSLHHIVCGIQRYLRFNGNASIDFLNDPMFAAFTMTLDAELKRLQKRGLG